LAERTWFWLPSIAVRDPETVPSALETIAFGNPDPMQLKIKPVLFYFWIGCGFTARCAKSARSKASAICSVTLIVMAQTHAGYL